MLEKRCHEGHVTGQLSLYLDPPDSLTFNARTDTFPFWKSKKNVPRGHSNSWLQFSIKFRGPFSNMTFYYHFCLLCLPLLLPKKKILTLLASNSTFLSFRSPGTEAYLNIFRSLLPCLPALHFSASSHVSPPHPAPPSAPARRRPTVAQDHPRPRHILH